MKHRDYKKFVRIAVIGLLAAVPLFLAPQMTHAASLFGIDLSPAGLVTAGFRAIAYIFNFIFGLLYLLGSYLVQVALQVNNQILSSQNQIVTIGWTILRDVANLGFVLIMIIVAVATILRYEKFSAKALLPKLIAAAIIVNFSLTIAGAFIVFANSITGVFLAGKLGTDPGITISNAFEPQALYLPPQNPPPPNPADQGSAASGFGAAVLTGIAGLVFSMVFTLIAALVMFALALMLIIRYVMLSILLLTAPITWLFWVFPPLSDIFHTWWKKFMQWVFFLPAVAFFIYLALTSVQFFDGMNINTATAVGGTLGIVFDQGVKMILLCGLMLGGLIVANNMGIAGAAGAMKLATGAGNAAKKWAGRTSQRLATAPLRTDRARKITESLQKSNFRPFRAVGNAISRGGAVQGEQLVKQATEAQKKLSDQQLAYRVRDMKGVERAAALSRLSKSGTSGLIPGGVATYINEDTKKMFAANGQGKAYGDMEKSVGFNAEMLAALKAGDDKKFEEETKRFFNGFSIKDFDKLQGNILSAFNKDKNNLGLDQSEHERVGTAVKDAVFEVAPGGIAKIRPKLKGDDLTKFNQSLNQYISDQELSLNIPIDVQLKKPKEKLEYMDSKANLRPHMDKMRTLYNTQKNMGGSLLGSWAPTGGGGGGGEEEGP